MSRYVGWNEAASRIANNEAAERHPQWPHDKAVAPTQALRSFTPVNNGPAVIQGVNNAVRTRARGLDSDMLYDIPDEPLSNLPSLKKRRRIPTKPGRPKSVSSSVLAHPWQKETEKISLQLTTPPDSKKRSSNRSYNQTKLFPNALINKPLQSPMRFTTTEDFLKTNIVSLGQTTMDKVAAFRFQPTMQCFSNVEAHIMGDSQEGIVDEPFLDYGIRHDSTNRNEEETHPVLDEPNMLDYNDGTIMVGHEGSTMSQRETTSIERPDSEDDFPLDDGLETEMAHLSMPDKIYQSVSQRLHPQSMPMDKLHSRDTGSGHPQPSSPSSYTFLGDNEADAHFQSDSASSVECVLYLGTRPRLLDKVIQWPSLHEEGRDRSSTGTVHLNGALPYSEILAQAVMLVESNSYSPLKPFARPRFPLKVRDRSPINGVSSNVMLRTCFRIGEALREGALCERSGQDAVIELFARVTFSSKDGAPSKLYFQFADLFHDRPPFMRGILENNRVSGLQETESRMLLEVDGPAPMVRCLGRLKRVIIGPPGWMLNIINIRATDWEEVRWTRQIAGAGMRK